MPKRGAKAKVPVPAPKQAKAAQPTSAAHENPVFCFRHADLNCDERWAFRPSGEDARELLDFLSNMAQLTWVQIEQQRADGHKRHHSQDVDSFDGDAKRDFRRSRLGERFGETMFRFRLSGEKRLWGFRVNAVFHVIWWDANHKVCPVEKRHT